LSENPSLALKLRPRRAGYLFSELAWQFQIKTATCDCVATKTGGANMKRIIGRRARYKGKEHPYLSDVVIIRAFIAQDTDDVDNHLYLDNDADIEAAGGVKPDDRVEVRPVLPDGRLSWVTSDPRMRDLKFVD
jgi:hypothetical protein